MLGSKFHYALDQDASLRNGSPEVFALQMLLCNSSDYIHTGLHLLQRL